MEGSSWIFVHAPPPEFVVAPLTAADPTNIKVLQTYFDALAPNQRLRAKSCRVCSICGGVFGAYAGSRVCVCDHLEFLPAACAQRSAVQRSAGIDVCRELVRFEAFIPHPRAEWLACWTQAQKARVQIAAATLSGSSLRQTVHTRRASVRQAAKPVAALLMVAMVTAGLAESNDSLPPGL